MATVFTAGHSTRTAEELVALLGEAGVRTLVDVRRFPGSRRNPQHGRAEMETSLALAGIRYVWMGKGLGGRRKEIVPAAASRNAAWTEPAFRNYADGMETPEFASAFAELAVLAREAPTAILCAERVWWRCHRRLLADLLVVRGFEVQHLLEPGSRSPHALSEWARVEDGVLSYPALV